MGPAPPEPDRRSAGRTDGGARLDERRIGAERTADGNGTTAGGTGGEPNSTASSCAAAEHDRRRGRRRA